MKKNEKKSGRTRTPRPVGRHWCGGVLVQDGRRGQRCLLCDRVRFLGSREN